MDINQLAILVNKLGGYDETQKVIKVDSEVIERAITGERLSRFEQAELENGVNQLYLKPTLAEKNNIDLEEIEDFTTHLQHITDRLHNVDFESQLRASVANDLITPDELDVGAELFINLSPSQQDLVSDILASGDPETIGEMLQSFFEDHANGGGFWDIENSAFWEWFRETFYGDD